MPRRRWQKVVRVQPVAQLERQRTWSLRKERRRRRRRRGAAAVERALKARGFTAGRCTR
jgi:hypothetical protein